MKGKASGDNAHEKRRHLVNVADDVAAFSRDCQEFTGSSGLVLGDYGQGLLHIRINCLFRLTALSSASINML